MSVKEINTVSEFQKSIDEGVSLVDFYAVWCGPCKMLSPIIESLSGTIKDVKFLKVDVDKNEELIYQYQIQAMPTICIFKDGKLVDKNVGFLPEVALKKFIEKNKN